MVQSLVVIILIAVDCAKGHYKGDTMVTCKRCSGNTYSKIAGAESCADCAGGFVSRDSTQCSTGEWGVNLSSGIGYRGVLIQT